MNVNISSRSRPKAVGNVVGKVAVDDAARAFAALGDPVRLRLFQLVAGRTEETCACDLVGPSGRSQPTVSHHMKVLVDAGLVQRTKRGQWVWYRADETHLAALAGLLDRSTA